MGSSSFGGGCCSCEEFVPPPYHLCHIIWNVFLIDKPFAQKESFDEILRENAAGLILAILPHGQTYASVTEHRALPEGVTARELPYENHDENIDFAAYDACCAQIEELRSKRRNVFVFCNSGYQRSLPFLCHYLVAHHADEIPTVERAMDTILPQVSKQDYASCRAQYVDAVKKLLASRGG